MFNPGICGGSQAPGDAIASRPTEQPVKFVSLDEPEAKHQPGDWELANINSRLTQIFFNHQIESDLLTR